MKTVKLIVKTKNQKYPIIIGNNLTKKLSNILKKNSINFKQCLIVIDKNVPKKFIKNIKNSLKNHRVFFHIFNTNEKNKNLRSVNNIIDLLLQKNFSREDCLISVGGGITGDTSGFAASLFKRGIRFINIPTTLLSQVDSSVGGKTGVNTQHGKNLIGSFYQPCIVISDTQFLQTLPRREVICGYGEILKHAIIKNKNFFDFLNKNIKKILHLSPEFINKAIYESCKIKMSIVEKDEKETGLRKILNFGHTFAHAYEASSGYSKNLNHGEAVILGIRTVLNFSYKKNILKEKEYKLITNHIEKNKLILPLNNFFKLKDVNKILSFMIKDKKNNSSKISLVLIKKIGLPLFNQEYSKKNIETFLKNYLRN